MNPSEHELAGKIVQHLNYGADHLDRQTRERLLAARQLALSRYKNKPEPVWSFAWAGHPVVRFGERQFDVRYLTATAALVVLVVGLFGLGYWQKATGRVNELAEIDAGILADDLPINAYLDRGFDSWLKRSSR